MREVTAEMFREISINGRFIYGYLCLLNAVREKNLCPLLPELDDLFHEFVSSDRLDIWHEKAEHILPSFVMETDQTLAGSFFDVTTTDRIRQYYVGQPAFFTGLIDDLFWLGISNLYAAYRSAVSLSYLEGMLGRMNEASVSFPSFEAVEKCSASQKHGWGDRDNLARYYDNHS